MFLERSEVLKKELRFSLGIFYSSVIVILLVCSVFFGRINGITAASAIMSENFLPMIGTIGILSLFYPERKSPIKDLLNIRRTDIRYIYTLRFSLISILYLVITVVYIYLTIENETCENLNRIIINSYSIGILLGSIGSLISSLSNNIVISFLTVFGLILSQVLIPKGCVGNIGLFSFPQIRYSKSALFLFISIFLIVVSILNWKRRRI